MKIKKLCIIITLWGVMMNGCAREDINDEISDYSQEKYTINTKVPYGYTIYKDLRGCDNSTILYYMHGHNGNEATWYQSNKTIINEWRKTGKPSPVVVGISFGKEWLLISKNPEKVKSGYLELFVDDIMPAIERQLGGTIAKRYVMGFSMGGANAAQLLFRYPDLFEKGVLISPNIFPLSIFSDHEIIDEFVRHENSRMPGFKHWIMKNILGKDRIKESVNMHFASYKDYIPNQEIWDKFDILVNIKKAPQGKILKVYIACGDSDYNGFYPGAEKLALKASSLSYSVLWKPFKGGHIVKNEKEIATFLIE